MKEIWKNILEIAIFAPSGDNMQPWKFIINNDILEIYNVPEKDTSFYNFNQYAAIISHGALLENINIISPIYGFQTNIEYFPNKDYKNLVAKIKLNPIEKFEHNLFKYIKKRHTNRKVYKKKPLQHKDKMELSEIFKDSISIKAVFIEEPKLIQKISFAISQGDRLIFENKEIHDFLFSHIRWDDKEEMETKNGLYLKTMELNFAQILAFKIFKKWKIMSFFNSINFPKLAVKGNLSLYQQSSAIIALTIPNSSILTYLELGKYFQRFWLTATKLGLSIQPLTGIPLLKQRLIENKLESLTEDNIAIINTSYDTISNILKLKDSKIGILFRIGLAQPPSGISSRLKPEINIKV